jgi:hypothetical protein
MATQTTYPHIEKVGENPAHLSRLPRIRVAMIAMDYLAHGWSVDEMCRQHAYLSLAEAHAAMTYYFDHQAEIDVEIQQELIDDENARRIAADSPFVARQRLKRHC